MSSLASRLRGQSGQATIEFGGMLVWLLLAGLFAWQLALVGWTAVSANNAARTASRMASRGGDGSKAGHDSLSGKGLQKGASVSMQGDLATVHVRIPIVFPGLQPLNLAITETADMPYTG
jgi:hypothetical protein